MVATAEPVLGALGALAFVMIGASKLKAPNPVPTISLTDTWIDRRAPTPGGRRQTTEVCDSQF